MTESDKLSQAGDKEDPPSAIPEGISDFDQLLGRLTAGDLTSAEQARLGEILRGRANTEETVAKAALLQESFSGPIPPARELNQYDEETRHTIVDMARVEQQHAHEMRSQSMQAAIERIAVGNGLAGLSRLLVCWLPAISRPIHLQRRQSSVLSICSVW